MLAPSKNKKSIIPLRFKSLNQLHKSYMPWLKNGGLFVPTRRRFEMGQEFLMMVVLPDMEEKFPAAGVVAWLCPPDATDHPRPGAGLEFMDESGKALRYRIEALLAERKVIGGPGYTL